MTKPLHHRPFNIEHARAGAPFCCANGDEVEILKWDRKHTLCIVGLCRQDAAVRTWRADGSYCDPHSAAFPLVMTPLGYIDGKPVFVGDEVTPAGLHTVYLNHQKPSYYAGFTAIANAALRHAIDAGQVVVPDAAAPTKEAYDQCNHDLGKAERLLESLGYRSAGNGEWTPPADRSARDMAIAEAVRQTCADTALANAHSPYIAIGKVDLAAIISKVPA